jgi:hypothetical protein
MKSMQMQIELGTLDNIRRDRSVNEIIAVRLSESPTGEDRLMESICERENMLKAFKRVESNSRPKGDRLLYPTAMERSGMATANPVWTA